MALGAIVGVVRAAGRGQLPLWMAGAALVGACAIVNPLWGLIAEFMPAGPLGTLRLVVFVGWAATLWITLAWAVVGFWRSLAASRASGGSVLIAAVTLLAMV
jgi:hypothetical protein